MSGAFSKALRVVALLCVLMGFTSSAWGTTYYLWYNAKSNEPNYKDGNFTMSAGATLTNNKCVWTISNLRKDNSYFYISTSSTYSESNLKSVNIQTNNPNDAVVNSVGKQDYGTKVGFYVSCKTAGSTVTITIDFSSNSQYVVSPVGGAAAACTPSATITGATYDGTQIVLSGTLTEVCTSSVTTWYGWQYKTDVNADWSTTNYIAGKAGSNQHQTTTAPVNYTNTWTGFEKGKTYYFRAYALQNSTWYSDNKILSVAIPNSSSSTGDDNCDNIVYLKPGVWDSEGSPRYEAYFWADNISATWVTMTAATSEGDCSGLYYAKIPEGCNKVIFVRMNPSKPEGTFDSQWNKTGDLDIPAENRKFTINVTGNTWNDVNTTNWSESNCTEGCTTVTGSSSLLLSSEVLIGKTSKTAQMFAYLKETGCNKYTKYGFYYCSVNDGDAACTPNGENKITIEGDALERGEEFNATLTGLEDGQTYYYRAYATTADETKTVVSDEIRSFATDPCIPQYGGLSDKYEDGTPIVYTINADPTFKANDCKLYFNSLQDAINHLKETYARDNDFKYVSKDGDSYNLNQPVEMRVVYYDDTPDDPSKAYCYKGGTDGIGQSAGKVKPTNMVLIKDFNKTNGTKTNTLTIKAGSKNAKPWVHHITIRQSKNIVLDSLAIFSDPSGAGDNALEIDIEMEVQTEGAQAGNPRWDLVDQIGEFSDANILVKNSMIGSAGFTGVHIACYDGVTFKNNEFEAIFSGSSADDINWGASAKFMFCKNLKFIQNNFRGDHATLMWIQECTNMLTMNNVYWNTNQYSANCVAIRLVDQFGKNLGNVGFYYNTFYLANNLINSNKYDFLMALKSSNYSNVNFSGAIYNDVEFMYNNCYSYDTDVPGKYQDPTSNISDGTFCPNNFWSEYDQIEYNKLAENEKASYVSAFAFSCADNEFINVKSQVCSTTASGPASLIVKGKGMDYGVKPDISTTGITLEPNEQYADRYIIGARPADGKKWTYGAYQSKDEIPTQTIYWVGKTSDWDDRNNWEYETEVAGQMVRQRVSCVNTLSEDLKVVIEEIGTVEIQGGRKWPVVPVFEGVRTNSEFDEHVSAGLGTGKTPTKFASYIELEHGAGIIGVEHLKEGETLRYDYASTELQAPLKQWMLVGPVIKPFKDGSQTEVRNVVSNDYYLERFPAVQMHGADIEGNTASWGATFPDLDKSVVAKSAYAIKLLDAFGTYKLPAEYYDMKYGTNYTDFKSHTYTFKGRFYNENALPNYEELEAGVPILLNNTYPANIDAYELNKSGKGTVQLYNYSTNAFDADPLEGTAILSQHAFVFTPAENGTLVIDNTEWFLNSITRHRSGSDVLPTCRVQVKAIRSNTASNVVLTVDELKDDEADYATDAPKIFNSLDGKNELTIPDIYVMRYNKQWSGIRIPSMDEVIPLGIRINHADAELEFSLLSQEELGDIILEDRLDGKKYNLSEGEKCYVSNLEVGDCEGRFFINLSDIPEDDTEDNISTEIEDSSSNNGISIITKENSVVISCSSDIELKTIYINDMSGKTAMFNVSGQYAEIELPVAQGVYIVNVIGDTATKTGKVILK